MTKETDVNIRFTIANLLMVVVLPFIVGTPLYLLGSLMTWSFQIGEWHWAVRGVLSIIFFIFYMTNLVSGFKAVNKRRTDILQELKNNPEISIKQAISNLKQNP